MKRTNITRRGWLMELAAVLVAAGLPCAAGASDTTYSGQATVINAAVAGLSPIVLSDAGPLPSGGGALDVSLLETNVPGLLSVDVLHASTVGQGNTSRSEASVADLALMVGGNTIAADFLMANAQATCASGHASVSGSSQIANLLINGQPVAVGTQPNQRLNLPAGYVIINEQTSSASGGSGQITVHALHVVVPGLADVVISSAEADINCGGTEPCLGDFVTGGGWITGTPSGAKGTFGVAGGIKNGGFWGHLTYIDHGSGMRVKGTGVTGYEAVDTTTRRITGTCEINGQSGFTYTATVSDNGEPGTNDVFDLSLSNGYSAGGKLGGGNIQLHTCK